MRGALFFVLTAVALGQVETPPVARAPVERVVLTNTQDPLTGDVRVGNQINDLYYAVALLQTWMRENLSDYELADHNRRAGRPVRPRLVLDPLHRSGYVIDPLLLPPGELAAVRARGCVLDLRAWEDKLAGALPLDRGTLDGGGALITVKNCDGLVVLSLQGCEGWTVSGLRMVTHGASGCDAFLLLARDAAGGQAGRHVIRDCEFRGRSVWGVAVVGSEVTRFERCEFSCEPDAGQRSLLVTTDSWDEFVGVDTRINGPMHTQTGLVVDDCRFSKRSTSKMTADAHAVLIRGSVLNVTLRDCGWSVGPGGVAIETRAAETAWGRSGLPRGLRVSGGWFESGAMAVIRARTDRADRMALGDVEIDLTTTGRYPWMLVDGLLFGQLNCRGGRVLP